jgi:outer membrane protein
MHQKILAVAITTFAALTMSGVAVAHQPGDVILRVGVAPSIPDESHLKSDIQFALSGTWIVVPHLGIELSAATPFNYKVKGDDVYIKKITVQPITLSAQYFFLPTKSRFQPYVGLGLNYSSYDSKLSSSAKAYIASENAWHQSQGGSYSEHHSYSNTWGLAVQVGTDFALTDSLFLNASVQKIYSKTTWKYKERGYAPGIIDYEDTEKDKISIDPLVFFFGVGFRF